ncbi:MAG: PqqD family protein [Oligoflexia bacterium]|nr:PqqD family protein [Oligoflexia bacterium]
MHLKESIIFKKNVSGEISLLDLDTNKMYSINGMATEFWEKLSQQMSVEEILKVMSKDKNIPLRLLRKEADVFLRDLRKFNILKSK